MNSLLTAAAPSKINLYLKVTGRREDGYHLLESLFVPLSAPADDIAVDCEMEPGQVTVATSRLDVPGGVENLAGKAALRWAAKAAAMPGWDIQIVKNIPVAAGMGGGSSDAGTVLRLLNRHYGDKLTPAVLAETALELGADVPFFLDPRPAVMTGIGELAEPLAFPLPELPLLIVAPGFPVSAAEAYRRLAPERIGPADTAWRAELLAALRVGDWEKLGRLLVNDLAPGVFEKYPILPLLEAELRASGALGVAMTGSGPTLFALFADAAAVERQGAIWRERYPEFQIVAARGWSCRD